jgi:hypothetical protein
MIRAEAGIYRHFTWNGTDFVSSGNLKDSDDNDVSGGDSPAALAWPGPGVSSFSTSEKKTLALLPDSSGVVRLFLLDYATGKWTDLEVDNLGTTVGKPILAYRHLRMENGEPLSGFSGHLMLGRMRSCDGNKRCAYVRISELVSQSSPPGFGLALLEAGDWMQNHWATVQIGTNHALYSDAEVDNVFGLSALSGSAEYGINFYPHSDGSPARDFGIRSDFRVMEDGICRRIAEYRSFDCGTINVLD